MKLNQKLLLGVWVGLGAATVLVSSVNAQSSNKGNTTTIQTNCATGSVIVNISDLNYSAIQSLDSVQTTSGTWATSTYNSPVYGEVDYEGIMVEDNNANCGLPTAGVTAPLWIVKMNAGVLSGADDSDTYTLSPSNSTDDQFDYTDNTSNVVFNINTAGGLSALAGNGANGVVSQGVVSLYSPSRIEAVEANIVKRSFNKTDLRKWVFEVTPAMSLTVPANLPSVTYEGSLYVNLYASANSDSPTE